MTVINFTSTTGSGWLESDYNQLVGLFEDGTYSVTYLDVATLKINGTAITATANELNSVATKTVTATAGEALVAGDICYLKTDGKYWKADASAESTASTKLLIATASISADASGTFGEKGYELTTTGLTAGSNYYLSETAGAFTTTTPSTSAAIIRLVGTAFSTTVFIFNPEVNYMELS